MADPSWQYINHPHRKPIPSHMAPQPSPTTSTSSNQNIYAHSRTRTTSSNIFPIQNHPQVQSQNQNYYPSANTTMLSGTFTSRRTPSTNTFSTTGSSNAYPNRVPSSELPRRSTSRGSTASPTSYVALMRKQKATVWCDRAQAEDPRLLAAQRAAKIRAASEVHSNSGRTSTSLSSTGISSTNRVAAKIRHHGKSGLTGFQGPTENFGVGVGGVPMRLSASEVEGGDSDDDNNADSDRNGSGMGMYHHRSGSGRSSFGSDRRRTGLQYRTSGASSGRWSQGNTPPSERERNGSGLGMGHSNNDSLNDLAEETPMPTGHVKAKDYFSPSADGTMTTTGSGGSGSSGERADNLGELGGGNDAARLASNSLLKSTMTREKSTRNPEELRRRGSVDERTMTITGGVGRLFVANPDLSDED